MYSDQNRFKLEINKKDFWTIHRFLEMKQQYTSK